MSNTLTPWRSVSVEIYRYRQIGILFYSHRDRSFSSMLDFVRRCGTSNDSDGFRHVYADASGGRLRLIDVTEIDWTGLDEALAAVRARRAA